MSWNEPGNGKQRDPWGGGDGGPPDLDEAFRKFRQKLGGAFGGGGSGSGGDDMPPIGGGVFGLILLIAVVVWGYFGIHTINEQERAVVLRFGKFQEVLDPGFNWNPAGIDQVYPVNVTRERQYIARGLMLTQDENIVELPITVQYNIGDVKAFVLNVRDPEFSLRQATDSALRHVVGSTTLDLVLSEGRGQIGDEVRSKLQTYLDSYGAGISIVKVNIQEAKPPAEVKAAFDDVIKAKEDEERLKNEAYAYANGIVPEARGRAQRQLEEAAAYASKVVAEAQGEAERFDKLLAEYNKAPEVTRERLYIDAVQRVMENSSKVLVDVPGGNNVMYLPLDRIGAGGGASASTSRSSARRSSTGAASADQIADEVIGRLRNEAANARTRERR